MTVEKVLVLGLRWGRLRVEVRQLVRPHPALNRISANESGGGQTQAGLPCHSTCPEQIDQEGLCVPFHQLQGPSPAGEGGCTRVRGCVRPPRAVQAAAAEGMDPDPPQPWKSSLKIGTGKQTLRSTVS